MIVKMKFMKRGLILRISSEHYAQTTYIYCSFPFFFYFYLCRLLKLWELLMPAEDLEARMTDQWQKIGFQARKKSSITSLKLVSFFY